MLYLSFDRINPSALLFALRRFGIPESYVSMISQIYTGRTFAVRDGGSTSTVKCQETGIAQGCPLSPYLFIMVMTVICDEMDKTVPDSAAKCLDITYADDTALTSECVKSLQVCLDSLLTIATKFGLTPNWEKTVHLQVRHDIPIYTQDGSPVKCKDQVVYLGAVF